ncbi:MAG: metallophosphoesterase [Eubacteriaceae bacterium]|nr:metallophosphoesterase [Eubacteriaceae bacterium]
MIGLKIFLIIVFLIFAEFVISNTFLSVTKVTVKDAKIPASFNGYKIVQLSDLHDKSFGKDNSRLIRVIDNQKPDIIVLTGDIINSTDTNFQNLYSFSKQLVKICPVYYIVGNHEQMLPSGLYKDMIGNLKKIGIIVLDNEKATLVKNGKKINLYGLWFNLRYYRNLSNQTADVSDYYLTKVTIEQLIGKANTSSYNILLAHNPVYFDAFSAWGADLTLSGHIHGGMIRIPFKGGLLSPEIKFFPKYDAGIFKDNGSEMFVSRGLGNGTFGIRLFNTPEIAVIFLESDK